MEISHYRALDANGKISTMGYFASADELRKYLVKRGLDTGKTLRIERENSSLKDHWMYVRQIII